MRTRKTNILFVNHASVLGGAERSLLGLLGHLDRDRFVPTVALPAGPLVERVSALGARCVTMPFLRLERTVNPMKLTNYLANLRQVVSRLVRLIRENDTDIVHANSNTAHIYAGPAARRAGIPALWHSRDLVDLGLGGRWMARNTTAAVAVSGAVRRHMSRCFRDPGRISTVHNGIDLNVFSVPSCRAQGRAALEVPADALLVGMLAHFFPWKNHKLFIDAASRIAEQLAETRFLIAGADIFGDHPAYGPELIEMAREKGLSERIIFTGAVENAIPVIDAMDVLVHPASREPFGRVVIEAMARSQPVVAVDDGGPGEIIANGRDGILVPPANPEAICREVLRLADDRQLASRLGAAARKKVEKDFTLDTSVRKIEAVYEELI